MWLTTLMWCELWNSLVQLLPGPLMLKWSNLGNPRMKFMDQESGLFLNVYNTSCIFIDYEGGRVGLDWIGLDVKELLNHLSRGRHILDVWGPPTRRTRVTHGGQKFRFTIYREGTLLKIIMTVHPDNGRHVIHLFKWKIEEKIHWREAESLIHK